MAVFEYTAKDDLGQLFSGIYEDIASVSVLRNELEKIGYRLIRAKRRKSLDVNNLRVKKNDVVAFCYKFAGMCNAGLTITQCLATLQKQTDSRALQFIIGDIKKAVETGSSLTDAFNKYRSIFSDFFLGMLEAGETGGKLGYSLEISAKHLEKEAELNTKLKNAFTYPVIVLLVCCVIITALIIFVVPVFSKIYGQLGVSLPGPTQTLVILSKVMRSYWPFLLLSAVGLYFMVRYIGRNKYIKAKWDSFKFRVPVFGRLYRLITVCNYIRSFAMLIDTGVPILKALEVSSFVANNQQMSEISLDIQKQIQAGNPVAESFEKYSLFPPIIVQLADSGEQASMLGSMLNKGVEFLERDIERITNALLVKLEPVLTLAMGAVIGLILMAVYLPMFDYMSHLQ